MVFITTRRFATAVLFTFVSCSLLSAIPSPSTPQQNTTSSRDDKTQWRKLQRGMSKDDVRKLIGEPGKVSVGKYFEFWYYAGGDVSFDSKGRLDSWDEP